MAKTKVQIIAGRRVTKPSATPKQVEKAHKTPADPRIKDKLSGLSLKQLIRATPPYIRSNSDEVVIKALKAATTKGGLPGIRTKTMTIGGSKQVYDTTVIGKEKGISVHAQKHVLVSCSCPWFWSHCEMALVHWGSAVVKYSNGEAPVVTNPSLHPLLCKHLFKLATTVLDEQL